MSIDYAALYADHDLMANHWWWRPGWKVGTRFYAWHITLDGQDQLHALADQYAAALTEVPTLDLVPRQWRHITLQGLGHVEEVDDARRDAAVEGVRTRLANLAPITSTYQRAHVFKEALALPPDNPQAFTDLRAEVRAGIADAWGYCPENADGFRAHASLAYSNGDGDGLKIRSILDAVRPDPATATVSSVSLIRMHRDHRMYEWETVAAISL